MSGWKSCYRIISNRRWIPEIDEALLAYIAKRKASEKDSFG